jgi:hypothetical protein
MSLTPDEIRAAAETHNELGPDYQSAVIDSFIEKVGREIDAKVDARLAQRLPPGPVTPMFGYPGQAPVVKPRHPERGVFALAVVSMVLGIPLTAIAEGFHLGLPGLLVIWIALVAMNVGYGLHLKSPSDDR